MIPLGHGKGGHMTSEGLFEVHISTTYFISTLVFSRPWVEEEKEFQSISLSYLDFPASRFPN